MFPSSSHPHHLPSASSMHHQPRQSKLLDSQVYSQPPSQAPSPSRIRTQQTAIKKNLMGSYAPNRAASRQSNNGNSNNSSSSASTPTCANCGTQTTPLWRRNQSGETLCNACALFQKMKGRPRPISLKTNVIKPRNRIKAIDRIPLGPSTSHNQQHHLLTARSNTNLVNLNHQANHFLNSANKNNQNYSPNPRNIKSTAAITPPATSLLPHSFHSNPIAPHLCSSSANQFHSPTSKTYLIDPHCLSPSPNNHIHPSSSQSPPSSQNSFCSTRSTPQNPTQLIRSEVSSRKSSPGGADPQDVSAITSYAHDAKRRKYLPSDLLSKTSLYERRISTGSLEPLHQRHHLPLRASSLARIAPTTPAYTQLSDLRTSVSNDLCDERVQNASPSNLPHPRLVSVDDRMHAQPPRLASTLSSGQQTPVSLSVESASAHEGDQGQVADPLLKDLNRGRSTLRPSRITLPPLSQITRDLVPAFQLGPSPINFGPPLSFEASARVARLNSPGATQQLLTIPTSTHQKKFEKRRAVSVISSVSDSESVVSPAQTTSTSSRIHSPLDQSSFPCNHDSPITPPSHTDGISMRKAHGDSKTYFEEHRSGGDKSPCELAKRAENDMKERMDLETSPTRAQPGENELNRLKNRIVQLELINGAMENRISELENTHIDTGAKGILTEASDHEPLSRHDDSRRDGFQSMQIDHDRSQSDHGRWAEESEIENSKIHSVQALGLDQEEEEDQIDISDDS